MNARVRTRKGNRLPGRKSEPGAKGSGWCAVWAFSARAIQSEGRVPSAR